MSNTDLVLQGLALLAGIVGMPVINALKKFFALDGKAALLVATLVSLVLGFGVAFLDGSLAAVDLTLEAVINAAGVVFAVATVFYKAILADK